MARKRNLMIIIFFALFVFIVLTIIMGSIGFEELVIGLLVTNIGFSFHLYSKLSGHIGWHKAQKS